MRKKLEIQTFLEYSMVVFNRLGFDGPVSCIPDLLCSKLQQGRFHNMNRFFSVFEPAFSCRNPRWFLALSWVSGLLLGAILSASAGESIASLMRALVYGDMSIVGLLFVAILPFLITAIAVRFSNPVLLYSSVFCRAFLCSYVALGLLMTFRTAGWLLCLLCLFCDYFRLPLLWLCWLHAASGEGTAFLHRTILCVLAVGLASVFDYCIVSPFLAELISF